MKEVRFIQKLTLPNTSYIENEYDVNARLLSTHLKNSTHSTLNSHQYSYDPANQRTQQLFSAGSTYNYTYDKIGQLKVADSATPSEDYGYSYDAAWNVNYTTNNGPACPLAVDVRNQLTGACGDTTFAYDANGNLLTNFSYHAKTYDDENRLVRVSDDTYGSYRSEFTYDGLGRLRKRQDYVWVIDESPQLLPQPGHWQSTGGALYLYDGWRVIQERDLAGTPTVSYTRGTDLSGTLEGAGGIGGLLARSHGHSSGSWSTHNYYHADGNGNITYLVNSSQTLAASYRYDPYGNTISSSGSLAATNVYRFSSKELHANADIYYYGYRWYKPSLQRWTLKETVRGGIAFAPEKRSWMRITGKVKVLNAHTVLFEDGTEVDLNGGMEAPELEQKGLIGHSLYPCGQEAAEFLRKLISDQTVTCYANKEHVDGKKMRIASGFVGETNLDIEMVRNGWAISDHSGMDTWEIIARENKRGLWRGQFVVPKKSRQGERLPGE